MPVFAAEKPPTWRARIAAGTLLALFVVGVYGAIGATFWFWVGDAGLLRDLPLPDALALALLLLVLLPLQYGFVRLQIAFDAGSAKWRHRIWVAVTVFGAALGILTAVLARAPHAVVTTRQLTLLIVACVLSFLFGAALWARFNNSAQTR